MTTIKKTSREVTTITLDVRRSSLGAPVPKVDIGRGGTPETRDAIRQALDKATPLVARRAFTQGVEAVEAALRAQGVVLEWEAELTAEQALAEAQRLQARHTADIKRALVLKGYKITDPEPPKVA